MGQPKPEPHKPTPPEPTDDDIIAALNNRDWAARRIAYTRLIQSDIRFNLASRLVYLLTEMSRNGGAYFAHPAGRAELLRRSNATEDQLTWALYKVLTKWKLFTRVISKHRSGRAMPVYRRAYKKDEDEKAFKLRVQRTIDTTVSVLWILRDLTINNEVAPHTAAQFRAQTGRNMEAILRATDWIVECGYIVRFTGTGRRKSQYVLPDLEHQIYNLLERGDRRLNRPHDAKPRRPKRQQADDKPGTVITRGEPDDDYLSRRGLRGEPDDDYFTRHLGPWPEPDEWFLKTEAADYESAHWGIRINWRPTKRDRQAAE